MTDQLFDMAQGLFTKLEAHSFKPVVFTWTENTVISYETKTKSSISVTASGKFEDNESFQNSLTESEKSQIKFELKFCPDIGESCPDLYVKHSLTQEDQVLHFGEDDPKVYLIDFWATWCGPCQTSFKNSKDMLERNLDWIGKVEIILISLDKRYDYLNEWLSSARLDKLRMVWAGIKGFDEIAPIRYDVEGIPTCVLIHKSKLIWIGDPEDRNLESDIKNLIEGKPIEIKSKPAQPKAPTSITPENYPDVLNQGKQKISEFIQSNPNILTPKVKSVHKIHLKPGKEPESEFSFSINGRLISKYQANYEALFKELLQIFPNLENNIRYCNTYTIKRGTYCNICKNELDPNQIQYLCIHCQGYPPNEYQLHYHCHECYKMVRPDRLGCLSLAHPHNVYRIAPDNEILDEIRFSKKECRIPFNYDWEPETWIHIGVKCRNKDDPDTGCQGILKGHRYRCVHCPNYDLCQKCFAKWNSNPDQEMIEKARKLGHFTWHLYAINHYPDY